MIPSATRKLHVAGWLSLAAFFLSHFSPAILIPVLVFAGLVFAAWELRAGSRMFGVVALCLSLLQGWMVLDHFGQLSSALGLVTAEDADQKAASRYASTAVELPRNWQDAVLAKCRAQWPSDPGRQEDCIEQQEEGASILSADVPADVAMPAFRIVRGKCAEDWPRDLAMRAACERTQLDAYRYLKSTSAPAMVRNGCAQKWPADFAKRRDCEIRQ